MLSAKEAHKLAEKSKEKAEKEIGPQMMEAVEKEIRSAAEQGEVRTVLDFRVLMHIERKEKHVIEKIVGRLRQEGYVVKQNPFERLEIEWLQVE